MKTRFPSHSLATCAAAVIALTIAGCGGGSGEAPPTSPGNVVTAAAPVVTITNNVTAEVASGDVTFTFSFNRDVGTSFTADDVVVTGGVKGAFTRTSGTSATLVVSPLPGVGGTIQVQVPANAVLDAGGAGNEAASASKAYTGGQTLTPLTFSTGFAANNLTPEGGAYLSYSGSNQDGFNCTGGAAFCGSGSGGSGSTSFFFSYYQTPTPATDLYNGISVRAPGVSALSATADTAGVQINGQTTVNFTFNNNPEWQQSGTNNFAVELILGKFYDLDPGSAVQACNIALRAVVTPLGNGAATAYAVPLSSFGVIQGCNTGVGTAAAALALSPVSEVAFKALAGNPAQPPVNGLLAGANLTVAANGVYPTTLALTGGISFQP